MSSTSLLQQALQDATDTRQVAIGTGALVSVVEIFERAFGDQSAVVIADYEHVLEAALRRHAAILVVVGSGTLNDLTKLAAQRCDGHI